MRLTRPGLCRELFSKHDIDENGYRGLEKPDHESYAFMSNSRPGILWFTQPHIDRAFDEIAKPKMYRKMSSTSEDTKNR